MGADRHEDYPAYRLKSGTQVFLGKTSGMPILRMPVLIKRGPAKIEFYLEENTSA
jgi:hypothetical protein